MKLFKDFWRIGVYGNAFLAVMMAVGWLMGPDYNLGDLIYVAVFAGFSKFCGWMDSTLKQVRARQVS